MFENRKAIKNIRNSNTSEDIERRTFQKTNAFSPNTFIYIRSILLVTLK